jgi:hypothetical protein
MVSYSSASTHRSRRGLLATQAASPRREDFSFPSCRRLCNRPGQLGIEISLRTFFCVAVPTFAWYAAQLAGQASQRNVLPWYRTLLLLLQFLDVLVYGIIEAQIACLVLIKYSEDRECLSYARNAI